MDALFKGKNMNRKRIVYIDILRILACFFVIFNHTSGFVEFTNVDGIRQMIFMYISVITKFAVPAFFMISGYMLLGKEESIIDTYKKRVLRVMFSLIAFSIMGYCKIIAPIAGYSYKRIIKGILSNNIDGCYPYWYLYSYLAFLIMLPFIRGIAKSIRDKEYIYMIFLHFVLKTCVCILCSVTDAEITPRFNAAIVTEACIFYPLVGYWLGNFDIRIVNRKIIILFSVICNICIGLSMLFTKYMGFQEEALSTGYVSLFDYVVAIFIFILLKKLLDNRNIPLIIDSISKWGEMTYGIYLLDPILRSIVIEKIEFYNMGNMIGSMGYCVFAIVVYGTIIYFLKKIPVIKLLF